MKNLCAVMIAVLVLVGCGSSGGGSDSTPAVQPVVATAEAPNLLFANVPTSVIKKSIISGAKNEELAAFRVEGRNTPIEQKVFTVHSTVVPSKLFKKVRLMSNNGNDVTYESNYKVRFDDVDSKIIIDFQYQWVPLEALAVPITYSLMADMHTAVPSGTEFTVELTAVQTHDVGKSVVFDVKGGKLTVVSVPELTLPTVATASPAVFTATSDLGSKQVLMGSMKVFCDEKSKTPCTFKDAKIHACGMSEPIFVIDDALYLSSRTYDPDDNDVYAAFVGIDIKPGETKKFDIIATPFEMDLRLNVIDMDFTIGEEPTAVSPNLVLGPDASSLLSAPLKGCPNHKG